MTLKLPGIKSALPQQRDLFYGGQWHAPKGGEYRDTHNPGNGTVVFQVAQASAHDVDEAVTAAHEAFADWRSLPPAQRGGYLRKAAAIIREHAEELALLDALNTGNPVAEMISDANVAAANLDFFAGLIPMVKGETIPLSGDNFHYTIREPLGVVARIVAYNHPFMFAAGKMAAPLAAGNTVIIKPPDQAPVSCLRLAEILRDVFPPGVLNILPGSAECGKALSTHPLVRKITLIGSVPTGKAIQRAAADTLKPTLFELGGKNALVAFPDADIDKLVEGVTRGMNFTWAGQSCGSTSRVFLHDSHHDEVVRRVVEAVRERYKPGVPTDPTTTMGPVISRAAYDRVMSYIDSGKQEGAELACGGGAPAGIKGIEGGYFIQPTIFTGVQHHMRIAREEIFGPVMSVFRWTDEKEVIRQANDTAYGLTAAVYTQSIATAQRTVSQIEAGFVWVNQVGRHFLGVPFGGYKESGIGREECLDELLAFTQIKSVSISLT
ncbi:betaine-aldehyde dehydrogenase [Xylariales sp. PMI_506]|nr:betaine-aldehyde dehydrogenase [Xylariales sp. PMI_506]